jgi:hypothetical protein
MLSYWANFIFPFLTSLIRDKFIQIIVWTHHTGVTTSSVELKNFYVKFAKLLIAFSCGGIKIPVQQSLLYA